MENLAGFIDIHVHSAPSIFPRSVTDLELARDARKVGMRGFVLKAHEESTVSRARILQEAYLDLTIYGALVLNWFVGGLNPYAVDLAIHSGAKIIWMPTGSAHQHISYYGGSEYTAQRSDVALKAQQGISILTEGGAVRPELYEILDLVAKAGVMAASGHLSPSETKVFVEVARSRGVEKVLVAHPDLGVNQMSLELQLEFVRSGAYVEKSYLSVMPSWKSIEWTALVHSLSVLGPERCVLQTDFGQVNHVSPPFGLKEFVQRLSDSGVSDADLIHMGAHNPADLLGVQRLHL